MGTLFKKIFIVIPVLLFSYELFSEVHTVKMLNQGPTGVMVFEPAVLKINIGDTVTFVATDAAHNSASIPGMLPANATAWNGQLSRDISVTFDIPGVYGSLSASLVIILYNIFIISPLIKENFDDSYNYFGLIIWIIAITNHLLCSF